MIRAIDFQKVDMTDEEFTYYSALVKTFTTEKEKGSDYFHNLFETNDKGIITIIKPSKPMPWEVIFFVMNLQQNQHLREFDERIAKVEKMLGEKNA